MTPSPAADILILAQLFWAAAYAFAIVRSAQDRSCGFPAVAIVLNVTWEAVIFFRCPGAFPDGICFGYPTGPSLVLSGVWLALDGVLLAQFVLYAPRYRGGRAGAAALAAVGVVASLVWHLWFMTRGYTVLTGAVVAAYDRNGIVDAFITNLLMSFLFLRLLLTRPDARGLSLGAAFTKLIGTALNGIVVIVYLPLPVPSANWAVAFMAVLILLLDAAYAAALWRRRADADLQAAA